MYICKKINDNNFLITIRNTKMKNNKTMEHLEQKLIIGLVEPIESDAKKIECFFNEQQDEVADVKILSVEQGAEQLIQELKKENITALVINIFRFSQGKIIIDHIKKEKIIPVCILGTEEQLANLVEYKGYCKIATDIPPEDLKDDIKRMSKSLFRCRMTQFAKYKLGKLKLDEDNKEIKEVINLLKLNNEKGQEEMLHGQSSYSSVTSRQEVNKSLINTRDAIKELTNDTLNEASNAIGLYKKVNLVIIGVGLLIILASVGVFLFWKTEQPEILAFGGLGLGGMIAALIKNPTSSIGKTAAQKIQIQIAYSGFLAQFRMIQNTETNGIDEMIKKSAQLNKITYSLIKTVGECFGECLKNEKSQDKTQNIIDEEKK